MRIFFLLIILCLVASAVFIFSKPTPPKLDYENEPRKYTLDNGLTVIIKSSQKIPMVAVRLIVKAGSASEGRYAGSGISHFVEHMLFKGTTIHPVGEIERKIKSYGGYINAATSHDTTEVQLIVKRQYLDKALELLSDFVFNPSFDKVEFERERDVILNEIRMNRDKPSHRASVLLWENAYLVHPYKYPVIGYEELFKKITRDNLVAYHSAAYVPNNCVLSVVGDIDPAKMLESTKELFGKLPRKTDFQRISPPESLQMSARRAEEELPDLKLAHLLIAFHSTSLANKDLYPLDLLAAALGQGESSRLYNKLVRQKHLAYSVAAYNYTPADPGLFIVSLILEEGNAEAALEAVLDELDKLRVHPLSKRELAKVRKSVLSGYIYGKESIEVQADDYGSNFASTGDYNFSKKYIEGINTVRVRDVTRVVKGYLKPDNMTVAVLKSAKKSAAEPLERTVAFNRKNENIDIEKIVLPDKAVLLVYEDHSLPIVSMSVLFKGGLRAEDVKTNGISHLVSGMLLKGTSSHSAGWIAGETESRGIILSDFSGKNSFGISVKCLKDDFDFSLGIVSDVLQNSNFPEKEAKILKDLQVAAIKAQEDDIFATASKALIKTIFRSHPYGMPEIGTKESVNSLTRADLVGYYRRFVVPDNMVITVFGDVDTAKVKKKLAGAFGSMHGRTEEIKVVPEPEQTEPRQTLRQMPKEQTVLLLGYPGMDIKNPDRYVLDVINSILSRAGGRLYREIREKLGLSYTLGTYSVLGVDPGYNVFYVATTYKNVDSAKRLIISQINLLKAEGPTQEEMELAKSDLTGSYFRSLEVNSEAGFRSGLDELYGLGYNNLFKYPEMVQAVTAEDVMRVANKYFTGQKLNEVVISPVPVAKFEPTGAIRAK